MMDWGASDNSSSQIVVCGVSVWAFHAEGSAAIRSGQFSKRNEGTRKRSAPFDRVFRAYRPPGCNGNAIGTATERPPGGYFMINFFGQKRRHGASAIVVALGISAFLSLGTGCSGNPGNAADKRFTTPSNDEYTQPLTNAVIGSPSGIVVIGPNGEASPAAAPT